uniref:Uncharacterized protein n=1 Tax=Caenorhabditis japonica TaxID=281687 RepID=A0A8R1IR72_CAEJA
MRIDTFLKVLSDLLVHFYIIQIGPFHDQRSNSGQRNRISRLYGLGWSEKWVLDQRHVRAEPIFGIVVLKITHF